MESDRREPFEGLDGFRVRRKDKIEILTPAEVEKFLIALDPDWPPFFAKSAPVRSRQFLLEPRYPSQATAEGSALLIEGATGKKT